MSLGVRERNGCMVFYIVKINIVKRGFYQSSVHSEENRLFGENHSTSDSIFLFELWTEFNSLKCQLEAVGIKGLTLLLLL